VTWGRSVAFAEPDESPEYTFTETEIAHTDIEADVHRAVVVGFGQLAPATGMQYTHLSSEWLNRAQFCFDLTFGGFRDSKVLRFVNDADALSSRLHLEELESLVEKLVSARFFEHRTVQSDVTDSSLDQAALPKQICDWLGISYEQLAGITGVSRSTFFNWRQPAARPRPGGMQRVQRLHALISPLVQEFGVSEARRWLHSEERSVWDRLMAGDLAAAEDAARHVRLNNALSAGRSVQVEVPGPFTPEHEREVSAYVDGDISAAELYRRTVARYRQS
jgi:hypothetical protein